MLHELLSEYRDEIVARCERKLRERRPDRPSDELVNSIPGFLDELIAAERRLAGFPASTTLPEESEYSRLHGEQRFRTGYDIGELPLDYGTISETIAELAMEHHMALDGPSYKLLNECIDNAVAAAISEYFTLSHESAEQGVAEWIGSLGHELRNAAASATMAFSAIQSGQVGLHSRTAAVLERSLKRIDSLITRTLAAVQLKSGMPLVREEVNVRELLQQVVDSGVRDRGIRVEVDADAELTVHADVRLLESALSNLVQNAIKFTRPSGRVVVRASAPDDSIVIDVEDECGGLGTQNPDQLFDAFVQGTRKSRGIGLGLAITRQAIEAHGGRVSARDQAPVGCVFTVVLPR
jgi:signal transduction histidine kinase